jgi:ribokinase
MSAGVICSGAMVFDIVARPVEGVRWGGTTLVDSIEFHVGGNAANTSLGLASLGIPVRVVAAVGRDEQGRFVLDRLRGGGVDTGCVQLVDEPTAATMVLVKNDGDRGFLHCPGASAAAPRAPIEFTPAMAEGMRHYHLASLFILPEFQAHAPESLRRARAAGLSTSLDTNWDPHERWMLDLAPCLPHLDVLFMNEDEARMITGAAEAAAAARCVRERGVRIAVMKLGARGCLISTVDGDLACPAFDVQVKDTTGAGDCFVSGFLAARLRGADLAGAGRYGNAMGARSVERTGAGTGVGSWAELTSWIGATGARSGI